MLFYLLIVLGVFSFAGAGYTSDFDPIFSAKPAAEIAMIKRCETKDLVKKNLIGGFGASPSSLAVVVFKTSEDIFILMGRDYDRRTTIDGVSPATYGALKAAFGYNLEDSHGFSCSYEALINGSANEILYNLLQDFSEHDISAPDFFVSRAEKVGGLILLFLWLST